MIALMGLDAQTGVFMLLFLDLSYAEAKAEGRLRSIEDLHEAIVHGAVKRVRPKLMTVAAAMMALDGAFSEQGSELVFAGLGHLKTSEVDDVLEHAVRRIERHLDRRGLLGTREDDLDLSGEGDPESHLASSAVPQGLPATSQEEV
jgi:hypothetical protein